MKTHRPWGHWEVLEEGENTQTGEKYKIKRLVIFPSSSISNQYHNFRKENWFLVEGKAQILLEDKSFVKQAGDSFVVENKEKHKVINISDSEDLVAIEIQYGSIVDETDIVRI